MGFVPRAFSPCRWLLPGALTRRGLELQLQASRYLWDSILRSQPLTVTKPEPGQISTFPDGHRHSAKATALSVMSNVAVCWTSVRYARIANELSPGEPLPLDLLGHISPLAYRHFLVNGTYRFDEAS